MNVMLMRYYAFHVLQTVETDEVRRGMRYMKPSNYS